MKEVTTFPVVTTTERDALTSVPTGTIILNSTTGQFESYNGASWDASTGSTGGGGSGNENLYVVRDLFITNVDINAPGSTPNLGANPGDPVLLIGQSNQVENGPYIYDTDSTPLVRPPGAWSSGSTIHGGMIVQVQFHNAANEETYEATSWILDDKNGPGGSFSLIVDTDDLQFQSPKLVLGYDSSHTPLFAIKADSSITSLMALGSDEDTVNLYNRRLATVADPVGDQDAATKIYVDNLHNPSVTSEMMDDFLISTNSTTFGDFNWQFTSAGAGGVSTVFGDALTEGHPGLISLATTVLSADYAGINLVAALPFIFGSNVPYVGEWLINIPTLGDGTDSYTFAIGFSGASDPTSPYAGAIFLYDHDTSDNWQTLTSAGGVDTTNTTSEVVATGWNKLRVEINAAGTSVVYKVNGVTIDTVTTNIPTDGTNDNMGLATILKKTVGTNERKIYLDYSYVKTIFNTPR